MSYARVNDASDSEDEAATSPSAIHLSPPPSRTRGVGSVAAATLAALTRNGTQRQGYSRLDEDDTTKAAEYEPTGARIDRHAEETPQERTGQSRRQSQDKGPAPRREDNADLEINIRFGEGQDLSLRVPRTDTIEQVKDKIKEARPSIGAKYLRLIHSGKILADNKTLIESLPKSLFTQVEDERRKVNTAHHQDTHVIGIHLTNSHLYDSLSTATTIILVHDNNHASAFVKRWWWWSHSSRYTFRRLEPCQQQQFELDY
ncbi:hypothetical protein BGX24_009355 [Mortierella sp. AD032]|nr:hypothetical protein BGX24_009355 [Mortierella sp. AD032]